MIRTLVILAANLLVLTLPLGLNAQDTFTLKPKSRVRVKASPVFQKVDEIQLGLQKKSHYTGLLLSIRNDTLFVQEDEKKTTLVIPINSIKKLERSLGKRKSRALEGGIMGFFVGMGVGYVAGRSGAHCAPGISDCLAKGLGGLLGGGAGAVGGTLIGAMIGASFGSERWQHVAIHKP